MMVTMHMLPTLALETCFRTSAAIRLENTAGTETYAQFNVDGASALYYDNAKELETTLMVLLLQE